MFCAESSLVTTAHFLHQTIRNCANSVFAGIDAAPVLPKGPSKRMGIVQLDLKGVTIKLCKTL